MVTYMGAALYIDAERAGNCLTFIERLLQQISDAGQPISFPYYQTTGMPNLLRMTKRSRIQGVSVHEIREAHRRLLDGGISEVKYLSSQTSDTCGSRGSYIALGIDGPSQLLVRAAFPKQVVDRIKLVDIVRRLCSECGCNYGHIEVGPCLYVDSLLQMWPVGWHGAMSDNAMFIGELEYLWDRRDEFAERIPRAAWGNVLSRSHVDRLGGEDRIRDDSGVYLTDSWNGNLYLQLSESPWCFSRSDLLRLNGFLEPARVCYEWTPLYWEPGDES